VLIPLQLNMTLTLGSLFLAVADIYAIPTLYSGIQIGSNDTELFRGSGCHYQPQISPVVRRFIHLPHYQSSPA